MVRNNVMSKHVGEFHALVLKALEVNLSHQPHWLAGTTWHSGVFSVAINMLVGSGCNCWLYIICRFSHRWSKKTCPLCTTPELTELRRKQGTVGIDESACLLLQWKMRRFRLVSLPRDHKCFIDKDYFDWWPGFCQSLKQLYENSDMFFFFFTLISLLLIFLCVVAIYC